MRGSIKKSIATIAAVGAIALGGSAVANASELVSVPDVSGLTGSAAVATLENLGFTNVHVKGSDTDGTAIGTNYQEGVNVDEHAAILVIVN